MVSRIKKQQRKLVRKRFTSKEFNAFRNDMLSHARIFYPDNMADFSESSVGGLFLDMACVVGDSLTFYMDHLFNELDPATATSLENISAHFERAGISFPSATPASAEVIFTIIVPAEIRKGEFVPKFSALPIIEKGTIVIGEDNITFLLSEDLDFAAKDTLGAYKAEININSVDNNGNPRDFNMKLSGNCISGNETIENFTFPDTHIPFRTITLANRDVSDILICTDNEGDDWYEVESLVQDTVFIRVDNRESDRDFVSENLEIVPAPKRFVKMHREGTGITSLMFGAGDPTSLEDDIIPDPSDLALELKGRKTFQKLAIDPNALLKTKTLGESPRATTLSVRYRHGGGLAHNVGPRSLNTVETLVISFKNSPTADEGISVRSSVSAVNPRAAGGGTNMPNYRDLRGIIRNARNSQRRIVTKHDLLARIYTMPSNFGRVYRASIEKNPLNPLANILYVISRDRETNLVPSTDNLKLNLSKYLNEFRLVSDAVDIIDARVINYGIKYEVVIRPGVDREGVLLRINNNLGIRFQVSNFQIGQPIVIDDISNVIINDRDVISLGSLRVIPRSGIIGGKNYAESTFSFEKNSKMGIISPPIGSIFELKYPALDIFGSSV